MGDDLSEILNVARVRMLLETKFNSEAYHATIRRDDRCRKCCHERSAHHRGKRFSVDSRDACYDACHCNGFSDPPTVAPRKREWLRARVERAMALRGALSFVDVDSEGGELTLASGGELTLTR